MNLAFSHPDSRFAFIEIIEEDGYIVYSYASKDDHVHCRDWNDTHELDGTPNDDDVLAALPDGFNPVGA